MGIFSRISDILSANINDLLDRAEDPEKMIKQMVIEMEESVNKTTLAVSSSIAEERNLQKRLDKARNEAHDWEQKAILALNSGREDLARQALEKKNVLTRNVNDLEPLYVQAKQAADNSRVKLDQLKAKLDEVHMRESTLIARAQTAKASKQISQMLSGAGSDAFGKFDKFESKVMKLESEAEAFDQLAGNNSSLEDEFKKLQSGSAVDDDLLKLKAKMGLLPQ
ncbi:MAG: PspA/IM30 family protein [Candidatus Kapabacteria bacterium]|nr:PspA/IM30 family protein [Candidatus Kapabacteria bacterium]